MTLNEKQKQTNKQITGCILVTVLNMYLLEQI